MRTATVSLALLACSMLGAPWLPPVFALDYDEARALAASARAKAREARGGTDPDRQLKAVEEQLDRGVTECASGVDVVSCRAVLRFALGGLAELRAESAPADRARWLQRAIDQYQAILADTPDHGPTLRGLADVHLRLGDAVRAETVLTEALAKHPEQDALAVMLGDFYRRTRRWDDAIGAYRQAAARNSSAELPRRRMVECYAEMLPQSLGNLQKLLGELEPTFPTAAELGYRAIIERMYTADRAAAEAALVRLVSVLANTQRLSSRTLDALPAGWTPAVELRRYVERPDQNPQAPWWLGDMKRRHVLTEAAVSLGRQAALDGDAQGAATRWEVGRRFAPEYDDYAVSALRGFRVARLDLQTALALHYFKFPSLDPGERKFNDVVQDLFRSKMGAYRADDLASIQRHHIILGTIFAYKKVWGRPGQVDAALFQLEHALDTASRRDGRETTYQPLPEVRAMLAETLVAVGQRPRALTTYVDAAQAYLDTDGLAEAKRMLDEAAALGSAPAAEQGRITALKTVLGTREAVAQASGAKLDPASAEYGFKSSGPHGWIFGPAPTGLKKDFADRQRFKTLSDVAERALRAGQTAVSDDLALQAFKTAVEDVSHLTGASDVLRIERIRNQATQQKVLEFKPLSVETGRTAVPKTAKTWVLTDAPAGPPAYLSLEQDDLVAAQVVGELHRTPSGERSDFRVIGQQVVLPATDKSELFKRRIERLPGIKDVVIEQRLPARLPKN